MPGSLDPIVRSVTLGCSVEDAYEIWTTQIHVWWPVARISASQDASSRVIMEGRTGGRLYERTTDGEEFDWGRVVRWEPPTRLVYEWFLGADPAEATEIDVRFLANDDGSTKVVVEHGKWEHAAADLAEAHRSCVAAPEGWTGILGDYEAHAGKSRSGRRA